VLNADQATSNAGTLHVSASNITLVDGDEIPLNSGTYVKVTVADEGEGIPAEIRERIFDPYFTTKNNGHGVGLAICHSIIERHQGHISASSSPAGTAFTFYLPALAAPVPARAEPAASTQESLRPSLPVGVKRILVMDDDEGVRSVLVRALTREGCDVVAVTDGEKAVDTYAAAIAAGERFDVVILDATIPGGMGGKIAVGHLRDLDPNVRAMLHSGYTEDPAMSLPQSFGFNGSLPKPSTVSELLRAIRDAYHRGDPS
jgi:CheY-like chemotaxis protein